MVGMMHLHGKKSDFKWPFHQRAVVLWVFTAFGVCQELQRIWIQSDDLRGFFPLEGNIIFFLPHNVKHHLKSDRRWFRDHISSYFCEGKKKSVHVFYQLPTITEVALQACQDVKCLQLWSHFWIRHFTIRRGSNIKSYEIVFMVASYSNQNFSLRNI